MLKHFFFYIDNDDDDYDNDYSYNNNAKYAWFHIELFPLRIPVFLFTSLFVFEIVSVVLYFQGVLLDLKDFFLMIFQIDLMLK